MREDIILGNDPTPEELEDVLDALNQHVAQQREAEGQTEKRAQ